MKKQINLILYCININIRHFYKRMYFLIRIHMYLYIYHLLRLNSLFHHLNINQIFIGIHQLKYIGTFYDIHEQHEDNVLEDFLYTLKNHRNQ